MSESDTPESPEASAPAEQAPSDSPQAKDNPATEAKPKDKPPAQVMGVQGFDGLKRQGEANIDWRHLCGLPPFQMWVEECEPNVMGIPSDQFAAERIMAKLGAGTEPKALFDGYAKWHKAKGAWPNETPMGEAK